MDLTTLLYLTGATGFFSSRAFIPAFFTALFLRYGSSFPFIGDLEFIRVTGSEPTWFTSNLMLVTLGLLSALEVGATKLPEAQELLDGVHKYLKTTLAALSAVGVLSTRDISFIEHSVSQANVLDMIVAAGVAGGVFFLNTIRSAGMSLLVEADPEDDLGIRNLISWFEDLWASFGLVFLILYPFAMLGILGIAFAGIYALRKRAERREEASKVPCVACGERILPMANSCPHCKAEQPQAKAVGFFGQALEVTVTDKAAHGLKLLTKRRCDACATRLTERRFPQECPGCGKQVLADEAQLKAYQAMVRNRLPVVLGVSALLSLIPVLGLIPGIIYYRIQLIAPLRAYIPASRSLLLRWFLRLLFLFLIALQLFPGVGLIAVPTMALLSYFTYAAAFRPAS
jgi:predicted RNA-binding Zn-ribbon protein involved in translation (DUF1610 family)